MKTTGNLSLRRFCLLLLMLVSYTDTYVLAAPRGGQVVSGTASFQQNGNLTTITAGNRSIINYGSFNIAAGETVRFVQPSAGSSVLNRVVGSADPTEIFGTLQANGHVYIANPYGIFFRNGSVINVGGLYAGAGNLSDADFTKGKIHFTDLAGDVRNDGVILANDHLALMGLNVVNTGTLRANTGMVMMVSGKDVYVGEKNSSLFVRANGNPSTTVGAAGGSVVNRGTVAAPRVLLGGGDLYSTAIANSGLLQGRSVTVNAGRNGTATVGGTVDASSAHNRTANGAGGSIRVLGGTVALKGATLDASGTTGGGSVRVGGDFHGGGTLAHATTTVVDPATTIKADATGTTGNGGTVVLWSDGWTSYSGQVSANAGGKGGDGGQVEVSSHGQLGFDGGVSVAAPAGKAGSLLLDPTNIDISAGLNQPSVPASGQIAAADTTAPTTISAHSLELLAGSVNIDLEATQDIRLESLSVRLDGGTTLNVLNLAAGTGSVTFRAGVGGTGSFVMVNSTPTTVDGLGLVPADTITAPGRNLTISASGPSTDGINKGDANAIEVGNLNTSSTTQAGGKVSLSLSQASQAIAAAPVQIYALNSSSTAGAGGTVQVAGATAALAPTEITVMSNAAKAINTAGSTAPTGGAISLSAEPTEGVINFVEAPTFTGNTTLTAGSFTLGGGGTQINGGGYNLTLALNSVVALSSIVNNTVADFTSLGAKGVNIDVASFGTTGSQVYDDPTVKGPITVSQNATLTAGNSGGVGVTFNGPVDSSVTVNGMTTTNDAHTLTLNATGALKFSAPVGAVEPLGSLTVGTGTLTLAGGTVDTTGDQIYNSPVTLAAATTLTSSNTGAVTFNGTLNGAQDLTVNTSGATTFGQAVGGVTPLASLTTDATGTTAINGKSIATSGAQTYNDAVTLNNDTTLTAGSLAVNSTFDGGGHDLTLNIVANVAVPGAFTDIKNFTSEGVGGTTINGDFSTSGSQTYSTFATLGATSTLTAGTTAGNPSDITFSAKLDGAFGLTLNTPGNEVFGGLVGGTTPLLGLATDATGTPGGQTRFTMNAGSAGTLNPAGVNIAGGLTINDGASFQATGASSTHPTIQTTGAQLYQGAATLGAGTLLKGTGAGALGAITFGSTVQGGFDLTLTTPGVTTFDGVVGGGAGNALASLTISAGGTGTTLKTTGVTTTGTQTYNSPLTLAASTTLTTTNTDAAAGAITFGSTVGGMGFDLTTATSGGNTVFGSGSGSDPASLLRNLTTSPNGNTVFNASAFETTGTQTYQGATVGAKYAGGTVVQSATGALTLTSDTGSIIFGGTVTSPSAPAPGVPASDLTVTTTATDQSVTFNSAVGGVTAPNALALNSLTVNSSTINVDGGLVNTTNTNPRATANVGVQAYKGALLLGADTTFVGKTLTASSGLDAQTHDLTLTLTDLVTVPFTGGFANINNFTSNGAGGTKIAGDLTTTGFQHYDNGPTTLGANVTLTAGTGGIRFGSNLSSPDTAYTLALSTGGPVDFNGVVGGGTAPLASLEITGGGTTSINGGAVTTNDLQNYGGPVVLGATGGLTTLTSNNGGQILFNSTLNGLTAGTQSLTLNTTGTMIFTDLVGASKALYKLATGSGTADINGASVTTQGGGQDYQGAVSFDGVPGKAVALTDTNGGALTFGGTVDNFAGGAPVLTLSTSGAIAFTGAVGGNGPLGNLTVTGGGTTEIDGGAVTSSGFQTYNEPVTLGNTATLTSTGGDITFVSTVNGTTVGAQGLTVNTGGNEVFGDLLGNKFSLASLTTDAVGTVGGQAQFNMKIGTAAQGVNVAGDVTINDAVLFAATGSTLTNPTVRTGGSQFYNDGGSASQNTALVGGGMLTSGTLTNPGILDFGGHDLSVHFGEQVTALGKFTGVRNFVSDGAGGTLVNGTFTTTGSQTYGNAVSLDGVPVLNGVGNITFDSTVDGNALLTLNVTGANSLAVFKDLVGNGTALLGLTTSTTGGTQFRMDAGTAATGHGGVNVGAGGVSVTGPVLFGVLNGTTAHPAVLSVGAQTYDGATTLGANTTLVGTGDITFGSTVDGAFALSASSVGNEIFKGVVGGASALTVLTGLTTDEVGSPSGQAQFTFALGGAQAGVRVNGPVTLNDAALFTITGAGITGGKVVPSVLTLGNGTQTYGGTVTLGSPTVFASTAGTPAAGAAFTKGGQITFDANVTSADPADRQSVYVRTDVGQTSLPGGVDANTVDLGGATVTFKGAVGPVDVFSVESNAGTGGSVAVGGNITTSGAQLYNAAVILPADSVFTAGGNIVFKSTVDSDALTTPRALVLNSPGLTIFNALVGNAAPLLSLTTDNQGAAGEGTQFNLDLTAPGTLAGVRVVNAVTINDPVTFNATGSSLAVPTILTGVNGGTGSQTYAAAATLLRDTVLTDLGTGDITFGGTVDGAFNLFVNTGGDEIFKGLVGHTTALASLQTDLVGPRTGAARFKMPLSAGVVGVNVNGVVNVQDGVVFNAPGGGVATVLSGGAQTYLGAATVAQNTSLQSNGGGILFNSTVDGPGVLNVSEAAGNIQFNAPVGAGTALGGLLTDARGGSTILDAGQVTTAGLQQYSGSVLLGKATALTDVAGAGIVDVTSTLDGNFPLTVSAAGQTIFGGAVGGTTPLASLTVLPRGGLNRIEGGSIITTGFQTYGDAVRLGTGAGTVLQSNDRGNVTFDSTLDAGALTVNTGGLTIFNGLVGGTTPLNSLTTDNQGAAGEETQFNLDLTTPGTLAGVRVAGAVTINDPVLFNVTDSTAAVPTVQTGVNGGTGTQTYGAAVTLARDAVLADVNTGNISFNGTVDGPVALTVNTAGATRFNDVVGGTSPLASLTTDVPGTTLLNARRVFTTGAQTYGDAVTLARDTTLTSTGGGELRFGQTLDGAFALTLNTGGLTRFGGAVGGATPLASVTTDAPGTTQFDGGSVRTSGAQTYNDPSTLGADTTLASAGGNILFASTLDSLAGTARNLTLNTTGRTEFDGLVGSGAALGSVTTDAGGVTVINGGGITTVRTGATTGAQTYNDAVRLGANTLVASLAVGTATSGDLTFNSTVDGAFALSLNSSGLTTLNGAVGGTTPLASLATDAGGTTSLGAGTVTTMGAQSYGDDVNLAKAATLASTGGGALTFGSALNGAFALTVNSTGNEVFNGPVGNVAALASLTTDADPANRGGAAIFNLALGNGVTDSVRTVGAQAYNDGVKLGNATVLTSQTGAVTAASVVGGGFDLTVNAATGTFGGIGDAGNLLFAVSGVTSLTGPVTGLSLVVRGGTSVLLNAGTVTTTAGGQSYEEPVTLGLDTTLDAAGLVNVASLDGGNHALTLTAPSATFGTVTRGGDLLWTVSGQTTLNGAVDAASLRVNGQGPVALNGGRVTTTGNQFYTGNVTLGAVTALDAGGGTINVASLTGKNKALTVTARRATFGQINNAGALDFADNTAAVFNGAVAADSLNVTGDTALNGGTVRTGGDQNYRGVVALGAAASLTSTNGAINAPRLLTGNGNALAVAAPNAAFGQIVGTGATTFQDSGTTTLNGTVDAVSLGVSGGQLLALNGGRITTSAFQDYAQPVVMGGDTRLASGGAGDVSFGSTLDGARSLTVDTAGTANFGGAVGGTTRLASLTVASGAASITGGSIQTTGNQQYNYAVTVGTASPGGTRLTSDAADTIFNDTVTGNGGGLFVQAHRVLMQGDTTINGGDLSLNAVAVSTNTASPLLLLDGLNYVSNGGSVIFNGADSTTNSDLSTVVLTNTGTVNIRGTNFTMGYLQKVFAAGALNIDVGRGVATVGDLAARQTLRINAREIGLLNRPSGVGDGKRPNTGLNFVADQGINFGDATLQYARPENQTASFITTNGAVTIQRRTGISIFRDPNLDTQFRDSFSRDSTGFFLVANPLQPVGGGSQTLDTAAAISGALPDQKPLDVPVDVTITASQMEELRKLGIHPRTAQNSERGSLTARQSLFAQLADGQDADNYGRLQPIKGAVSVLVPSDYVVVVNRMSEREVQAILQAFERLYGKNKEKAPEIGAAYQKAFDEYTVAKQTADPAGFGPYLKENQGKYPDVDQAGRGFDNLFGYIEHMGLTPVEIDKAKSYIVSDLNVNGPTPEDMVKVIDTQRKNLPPAQKAASTKAPPAPSMAAPAPAASPEPKKPAPPKSARASRRDGIRRTAQQPGPTPNAGHGSDLAGL